MTEGRSPVVRLVMRAAFASAVAVAVSVLLIGIAVTLEEGFWRTLLLSVGSAGFSIGGIGLLYEVYLRRTQTHDVLELVQLKRDLADVGIRSIQKKPKVPWADFFAGARTLQLLPADPMAWFNDEWPQVLEAGLDHAVRAEVYLPRPDGPDLDEFARRLGRDGVPIGAEIERILLRVEHEWVAFSRARNNAPHLRILTYEGVPSVGVARADARYVLTVPGVFETGAAQKTIALRFEVDTDSLIAGWVADQLGSLEAVGKHYETPQANGH